jgi:carbon-monoxide dehydrogenase large subunit
MGTYGSRSLAVGGSAIMKATGQDHRQGQEDRGPLLEADVADIEFENGKFKVAGTDKAVPWRGGFAAYVPHNYPLAEIEPGLDENRLLRSAELHLSRPARMSARSRSTRTPASSRSSPTSAVDDFGNIINPMIVEGQVHGGIVQGIGQALLEGAVYDKQTGQLLTGSFMDYTMPRADNLPVVQARLQGHPMHRTIRWA